MSYTCTDFSIEENWSFGERRFTNDFGAVASVSDVVTIGFVGNAWIAPFNSNWNISTTFSLVTRNDTGRINSSPRAITAPVIRLQEGCNHTIALAVTDPDGDIIRCRWAEGRECGGICNQFPGAVLDPVSCTINYEANRGARFWAAALMIEDFVPESSQPLSSVALQFLISVIASTESCSQAPMFVPPTIRQGSCVAIPPETTFVTQLTANSGGADVSITEFQTVSPLGTQRGEIVRVPNSNAYFLNISWTPESNQQNQTHLFCFTAMNSEGLASEQTCLQLLPGYYPPTPLQTTAVPNRQLVHPSNTTWSIRFDMAITRPSVVSYITFNDFNTEEEVYRIDTSLSQEVRYVESNRITITPSYNFMEKTKYYIVFERGVVQGLEECGPGNEPVTDKNFWTFETLDVTPPTITLLDSPLVSNANISLSWVSNENVTWDCILVRNGMEITVNCSNASWRGYGLDEGTYMLHITATDSAGNAATIRHTFDIDLTPPVTTIVQKPLPLSNVIAPTLTFVCNEAVCFFQCQFLSHTASSSQQAAFPCSRAYTTPFLQHGTNYTFFVTATDQVGNIGGTVTYSWETDFESPRIFGMQNVTSPCDNTSPDNSSRVQALDDRSEIRSITYSDINLGCSIRRTWTATDEAGNAAIFIQNVQLEFFPSISFLPEVAFPCDSTLDSVQVPTTTASAPNPCGLPLQLTYTDSESVHVCPSNFVRNWTVTSCGRSASISQRVIVYDLCPPSACGRNESTPRGICSLGECQCNRPWYGEECTILMYVPVAEPVNNTVLKEAEPYSTTITLVQGTPPLSWSLISGPDRLRVDQYTGQVVWTRAQAGNYTITVLIENQVGRTEVSWVLQVNPGYSTFLSPVSPTVYPRAQPVVLSGYVVYVEGNLVESFLGGIVSVNIDIINNGVTRSLRAFTQRNGNFSQTFYPAATEYGTYIAGSRHPGLPGAPPQQQWDVLGMRSTPNVVYLNGEAVSELERTFYNATFVCNDGPRTLTGLTVNPLLGNAADVIDVEVILRGSPSNDTLDPGDKLAMDIKLSVSRPVSGFFPIVLDTNEGTTLQIGVNVRIEPILPRFFIDPPSVSTRIIRGQSRVFEFNVTNVGRTVASDVQSVLPNTNIISYISFGNLQQGELSLNLDHEESAILSILVQTPANQQLGEITASISITSREVSTSIPITLIVSSDVFMNLTVVVEDEYTYFASGQPLVDNAAVTLTNRQRGISIRLTTDVDNGTVTFFNIVEDRYEMIVEAPDHQTLHQVIITTADNPVVTVFIQRQTVTYTWSVTPVTYQDTYVLVVEADFQTNVPIPVVTVTPTEVDLEELELGFVTSFQINITNHGLIRAESVGLQFPNDHPFLEFTTSMSELGDLEALSSVTLTVQVSRRSVQKRNTVIWTVYIINILYSYVCGDRVFRTVPVVLKKPTVIDVPIVNRVSCIGCQATGFIGNGRSDGTPGGGFSFNGYSARTPAFCNQCIQSLLTCVPTPNFPLAGCIPELARTDTNGVLEALEVLLSCEFDSWIDSLLEINIDTSRSSTSTRSRPSQGRRGRRSLPISITFEGYDFLNSLIGCFCDVYTNCLSSGSSSRKKRVTEANLRSSVNELVEAMYPIHLSVALGVEVLGDESWISVNDPRWLSHVLRPALDDASESGVLISPSELSTIMAAPPPNGTTAALTARMIDRLNNTLYGWNNGQLEPQNGFNMASFHAVQNLTQNIITYNDLARSKGFSSYIDAYNFASSQVNLIDRWEDEAGVCAVVRIRIEQELAVTREAFLARLEIENQEDSNLEQLEVEILISDSGTGEQTTHLFSIGNGTLSGSLSSANRAWVLPSEMSGAVEWLIIPLSEAAPESDKSYDVGGILRYSLDGENITIPLLPTVITVRPDPSLLVHYFWERYVVGDDPFTDEVEPSVPFTLGVAVKNAGFGTAYSLQITSGQPQIIENERGLLVNFMIIGASIGSGSISPSLTVMFGDLAPNTTTVARWQIISSLQGQFMNYSATFENINPLGDPRLSILDELEIHELIRNVMIYSDPNEDDGILDFLVNDRNDLLAYPDALYSSKTLQSYNVSVGTVISARALTSETSSFLAVRTTSNSTGWVYYRYEDMQGLLSMTASAVNGTKQELNETIQLPSENSWITRDRDSRSGSETLYLHIVDHIETMGAVVVFNMNLCTSDCSPAERPFMPPTPVSTTAAIPIMTTTAPMPVTGDGPTPAGNFYL